VHVDDFGTGYSSLSYLRQFDVDALKIDRSFITKMASGAEPDPIVRAIAGLAHGLGLEIVAEGIQTRTQYERLRELGCQYGQGYMFSRPLDPDYARALIVENPNWSRP
jgi:EAL domain-containing protein (putative c-di-GMP-specific phosphodiesterase class I)